MIVFTFIFNRMAGIESGDATPYPIFLYVGLLLWQYYSTTLTNAGQLHGYQCRHDTEDLFSTAHRADHGRDHISLLIWRLPRSYWQV